jgi:hypothetical protein
MDSEMDSEKLKLRDAVEAANPIGGYYRFKMILA